MTENSEKMFPNSIACAFQWNYPVINLGRNEYRNCCRTEPNKLNPQEIPSYGLNLILNSPIEREKRARMLLGEKVKSCSSCWAVESKGVRSPRLDVNLLSFLQANPFQQIDNELKSLVGHEEKVRYLANHGITFSNNTNMLEIVLTNTCDMACMYCSHHYSSKWAAERLKYKEISASQLEFELPKPNVEFKKIFLEWFRSEGVHSVRYITFIGGEPTLIKEFYEISKEIAEILHANQKEAVNLSVVTNLNSTAPVFEKFMNHIESISDYFSVVDINVSIEAFGEKAEYIRNGLVWERWKNNFEHLVQKKSKKLKISAQMATNLLSVSSLSVLLKYFWKFFEDYNVGIELRQNLVTFPLANSPTLLTKEFTFYFDECIDFLRRVAPQIDPQIQSEFGGWGSYANFLETIKNSIQNHQISSEEKQIIFDFYTQFDRRRRLNIRKTFPEYENFLNFCGLGEVSKNRGMKKWIMQKLSNILN